VSATLAAQSEWRPEIPVVWDAEALASYELPNAVTGKPARHVDADFYYRIPATVIYRTYPVYHPDRQPPGYLESLAEREPEVVFDASKLATKADWIAAGELVFQWPIALSPRREGGTERFRESLARVPLPVAADGTIPFFRYVVREKGKLEIGRMSCASCHTRVQADGTVIVGAQGNYLFDREFSASLEGTTRDELLPGLHTLFGMPVREGAQPPFPPDATLAEVRAALDAIPGGVLARHGSSFASPVQIPDLIGIENRRYLDRTGLNRHRGPGDLMRYAALNQGLDFLSDYDGFVPALAALEGLPEGDPPPGVPTRAELKAQILDPTTAFRYSDEQLYALALYLYDLSPPPSPHRNDERAQRGQRVFESEKCARCHPAPLYTSNELVPVRGFSVPEALRKSDRIRDSGIGVDPTLALATRRGTGFYKTPSLKGVWYRGPFEHNGSVATLEDWFDPARLEDDYVPTGWNPGGRARAVPGHEFGLDLSAEDREALIAFLRTL
jgi:cytochrome c2